jgi:protein-L-isoaspartate(D-aspartate) O-methyltransferase
MVVPVGEGSVQKMLRISKNADGTITEEVLENFSFVPMVEGRNN